MDIFGNRSLRPFRLNCKRLSSHPAETPRIELAGTKKVRISIPRVSSVLYQGRHWKDVSVDYQIAKVDYL
jgi:hypothetical protein